MSWTNKRRNWKVNKSGTDGTDKRGKGKELENGKYELGKKDKELRDGGRKRWKKRSRSNLEKRKRTCIKGKGARTGRNRKKLKEWSRKWKKQSRNCQKKSRKREKGGRNELKKGGRNWEKWVGNDRNDAEVV